VAAILQTDGDAFTAKQHEVLEMIYGRALSQREAATVLGISRAALRERLDSVNHKLRKLGVPTSGGQGRSNMELRRVVGWDFEGPPPATLLREGDLRI